MRRREEERRGKEGTEERTGREGGGREEGGSVAQSAQHDDSHGMRELRRNPGEFNERRV